MKRDEMKALVDQEIAAYWAKQPKRTVEQVAKMSDAEVSKVFANEPKSFTWRILANRAQHTPTHRTGPIRPGSGIKGTITYTRWDDGEVTGEYVYEDGHKQVILIENPEFFERSRRLEWRRV